METLERISKKISKVTALSELKTNIRMVVSEWNKLIFQVIQILPKQFETFISLNMVNAGVDKASGKAKELTGFSGSSRLYQRGGALIKSFYPKMEGTLTHLEKTGIGIEGYFGSRLPYARIQEKGGFVQHKGKMPYFFLHKYNATKNEFYKIMFLASKKNKGIRIPPRPYFQPAIEMMDKHLPKFIEDKFVNEVVKVLNG